MKRFFKNLLPHFANSTKRRPPSARDRRVRPMLDHLEDRSVPTVLFKPVLAGPETILWRPSNDAGVPAYTPAPVPITDNPAALYNPHVYLIFWGTSWTSGNASKLAQDVDTIINRSPYLSALSQYGVKGQTTFNVAQDWVIDNTAPPDTGWASNDAEIQKALDALRPGWSKPTDTNADPGLVTQPIYAVVYDNGPGGANNGYNTYTISYNPILKTYGNTIKINGVSSEDNFTDLFSHELVERISDGTGYGIGMWAPKNISGEWQNAQIADNEPDGGRYTYRLNGPAGPLVQAYWSIADQAFIVPDGLIPGGPSMYSPNGQYRLTLQTDGNLVEYNASGTAIWWSGTSGQTVTQAVMQSDGNFVLYNGATPVLSTHTSGHPGAFLTVGNDGNLVISQGGAPLWTSNSAQTTVLPVGQRLTSHNQLYYLVMQSDGNLVEYDFQGKALWSTKTSGQTVTQAVMQSDGNLVLYNGSTPVWAASWHGGQLATSPGAFLTVQDDGNVVIYDGNNVISQGAKPLWNSHSSDLANLGYLNTGFLTPGQSIWSPNAQYYLTLQTDGNLVEYNASGTAIWSSGTSGQVVTEMIMQPDGNLVLYGPYNNVVWSLPNFTPHPGAYLAVQDDGNVVVYDTNHTALWNSLGL
jgi:hypothetical protein